MKAVIITRPGGPEVLEIREVPQPSPTADQILVRVRASALNRADLLQRQGHYPAPFGYPHEIPGIEFAGEIVTVGSLVQLWKPGQRVFGLTGGGAHAEFVVAQERTVAEIPLRLTWSEAASIPEAFITAQDALWKQAGLKPGEVVLIHAIGSGVGLAALQLTNALAAEAYGTSRTAQKLEHAKQYGLKDGIVVSDPEKMAAQFKKITNGRAADVVLDLVGGAYMTASLHLLASLGRLIAIGTVAGNKAEVDLRQVLGKRITIRGTVLRARPLEEKIAVTQAFARELCTLFERGVLRPVIDSEFDLADAQAAHRRMESNETFGKVVLKIA
jgi:putative PIG3 family NAD(P)H quinone oxidoreductase